VCATSIEDGTCATSNGDTSALLQNKVHLETGANAMGPMEANNDGMTPGNTGATAAGPMEANNNGMIPGNTGTNVPASCPTDTCSPTDYTSCWNSRCASCAHCLAPTNVPAAGDHVYDPTNMGGTNVPAAGAGPMEANNDGMTPGNTGA